MNVRDLVCPHCQLEIEERPFCSVIDCVWGRLRCEVDRAAELFPEKQPLSSPERFTG